MIDLGLLGRVNSTYGMLLKLRLMKLLIVGMLPLFVFLAVLQVITFLSRAFGLLVPSTVLADGNQTCFHCIRSFVFKMLLYRQVREPSGRHHSGC